MSGTRLRKKKRSKKPRWLRQELNRKRTRREVRKALQGVQEEVTWMRTSAIWEPGTMQMRHRHNSASLTVFRSNRKEWGEEMLPVTTREKALVIARTEMGTNGYRGVRICQGERTLYDVYAVERLTDLEENGRVVVVEPAINPYWDEVYRYNQLRGGVSSLSKEMQRRLAHLYSYAILSRADLGFIARHLGPCAVSMGAGSGYWEYQLARCGVKDLTAYDRTPRSGPLLELPLALGEWEPQQGYGLPREVCWYPVARGTPKVLRQHSSDSLFLCFPPGENAMALQCLEEYGGNTLVLIGTSGESVATTEFYQRLEDEWEMKEKREVAACTWLGGTRMAAYQRLSAD